MRESRRERHATRQHKLNAPPRRRCVVWEGCAACARLALELLPFLCHHAMWMCVCTVGLEGCDPVCGVELIMCRLCACVCVVCRTRACVSCVCVPFVLLSSLVLCRAA